MTITKLLAVFSLGIFAIIAGPSAVAQSGGSTTSVRCYRAADAAQQSLTSGTRIFIRSRVELTQREGQNVKVHVLGGSRRLDGLITDGSVTVDNRKLNLDAGVPIAFSVDSQVCAVPPSVPVPPDLTDPPIVVVP